MDCAKVGHLILQLRKEKGLTQRQVAEQLNISNKTISKWECGLGCPDVSLWEELSAVLGADILKLLQGELKPNLPDVGKIDLIQFYVCPNCGNIITSTGKSAVSCCGRRLHPLAADLTDEDHQTSVQVMDSNYYVTFDHEMSKEHYILFAAYVYGDRMLLTRLYPEQDPSFYLPLMRKGGNLYFYCTKHGLQKYPFTKERVKNL